MILAIMRTQLRLMLRNWAFWIVSLGGVAMAVPALAPESMATFGGAITESSFRFFLLGVMLVTIAQAARERTDRSEELIDALPYRPVAWLAGRFLALYGIWLLASIAVWGAGVATLAVQGRPVVMGMAALNWVVVAPVSTAFATAVGLALGQVRMPEIVGYLLAAGIWIGAVIATKALTDPRTFSAAIVDILPAERFFPFTAQGYFVQWPLVLLNRLFLLALAGAILTWSLYRLGERRRLRQRFAVVLTIALAVGSALSAVTFAGALNQREEVYAADMAQLPRGLPKAAPQGPLSADRYAIAVALEPEQHRAAFTASFAVTNTAGTDLLALDLTLRSNFTVRTVETGDGRALTYQRNVDGLSVDQPLAPGETIDLRITYDGEVWQWARPIFSREAAELIAHITPNSVFLPAGYGWYPLPNRHTLRRVVRFCSSPDGPCQDQVDEDSTYHPPANMQVSVTGTDLKLVTNAGSGITGLYLIGTPFETVDVSGVLVTVDPTNRAEAERLAAAIAEAARFYDTVLPRTAPGPIRLIELHTAVTPTRSWSWARSADATPGAVLLRSSQLRPVEPARFLRDNERLLTGLWWPPRVFPVGAVLEGLGHYMVQLRPGSKDEAREALIATSSPALYGNVLVQVEKAKGRETAIRLLEDLHRQIPKGGPDLNQFKAAVQQYAGDAPEVMEAFAKATKPLGGTKP